MRRRRTNIDKQERLVSALWDFVADNQKSLQENPIDCMTCLSSDVKVNSKAIGTAISEIMDTFGYDVLEVQ